MRSNGFVTALVLGILLSGVAACAVHASTVPVGSAELYYGDPYVSGYPYAQYDGRTVYWYGDRWVYRDGNSWYAYRQEPAPLYRYRTTVRQAPPAYPQGYPPGHAPQYPPAYGQPPPGRAYPTPPRPGPYYAPPAR